MADFGQFSRFDPGQLITPAYPDPRNKLLPFQAAPNLTIARGQALGQKTSNLLMYPYNRAASDGTQNFAVFAQFPFATDSAGTLYKVFGGTPAGQTFYDTGISIGAGWTSGVFDPFDLTMAASGTPTAEVDTGTPTSPTTGDVYGVFLPDGVGATFTVGGTQTAAAVVTGLKAAWLDNPLLTAVATASGTGTFILTAVVPGEPMNLTFSNPSTEGGTGTFPVVITPATTALSSEVDTFTPGGTIAAADIFTVTINYPNLTTLPVTYTAVAGDTATTVSNGLRAAWNASQAANYGTASGTSTFIVTGQPGSAMNLTKSTPASATFSKSVSAVAYGRSFSDLLASRPGAYIESPDGYWVF
jgi:hypothetical protein